MTLWERYQKTNGPHWRLDNPNAREQIEAFERFEQDIPESLIPPNLTDVEWFYWSAFWELSTDRQKGEDTGPIPWSSIRAYASDDRMNVFSTIIRAMDDAYLSHQGGESKTFTRDMFKR